MYEQIEDRLREIMTDLNNGIDTAHDLQHIKRVVGLSLFLAEGQEVNLDVLIPAAWLHDLVCFPKQSDNRELSSKASAERAIEILVNLEYAPELHREIAHAIEAHSFSANIQALSLEAKILQDADRLDAIGAHGLARCLMVGTSMGAMLYDPSDPFAIDRSLDDKKFSLDHFQTKLFLIPEKLHTLRARLLAQTRVDFLKQFILQLKQEIVESSSLGIKLSS